MVIENENSILLIKNVENFPYNIIGNLLILKYWLGIETVEIKVKIKAKQLR